MKYLIFCLENKILLTDLIKLISKNYNINLTLLKKADFIKSNNNYIYKNQKVIIKILNLKKDFDDIDEVLYFESNSEFIPYFNVIKITDEFINKYNFTKNYILPKYINNSDYDYYYIIEFNMIDYIKYIQENDTFDENIDKLKDINNIVSNFDVLQFKPINVKLNVIGYKNESNCDEEIIFNIFINNLKNNLILIMIIFIKFLALKLDIVL